MNTPNLAAWFERYITDWTGPLGRIGKMKFRMKDSIFPGDTMVFRGTVQEGGTDDAGCGWADVHVFGQRAASGCAECNARCRAAGRAIGTTRGNGKRPQMAAVKKGVRPLFPRKKGSDPFFRRFDSSRVPPRIPARRV